MLTYADYLLESLCSLYTLTWFYYSRIKKGEGPGKYVTVSTMMHKEASESLEMTEHHVSIRQMID